MSADVIATAAIAALGIEQHRVVMLLVRPSDGAIVDANPAAVRFYGHPREVLCSMKIGEINQLPASAIAESLGAASRDEQSHFVFPHRLASGEIRTVEVHSNPVEISGTQYLFSIILDISDRVRAERALKQSEEKFSRAFHASPDSININRLEDGLYMEINQGFTAMTGYQSSDVLGRSSRNADLGIWVDDADRERMVAGLAERGEADLVAPFRRKDGTVLLGAMSARLIEIDGVRCVLTITRDITEKSRAEEQIRSLARFPDENPHPAMRVAPDGEVIYANAAGAALVSCWVDRSRAEFLRTIAGVWKSGTSREIEVHGDSRTYAVTIVPQEAGYVNLYGKDVTEEKSLAERLAQSQKMEAVGRLAGGIAHDFNNLLQVIGGYCDLVNQSVSKESPLRKDLDEISGATRRASALTAQLLAFSRKQILAPRALVVKDLIRSTAKMLGRVIGEDIELRTFVNENTGNVWADPGQIEQILLNLAVNARDAMPLGGKLTVEAETCILDELFAEEHPGVRAGSYVRISVSDTGTGMTPETLSHIYEPFFTTKEQGKGTGLGLSTVFGIVKQTGGTINCYSEVGKGTTFTIYLPMTSEQPEPSWDASVRAPEKRGDETILLVEDEAAVRRFARTVLEREGYTVIEAGGGEEALSQVSTGAADIRLLITDVVMPRLGGRELARRLEEMLPALKILYVSGYTSNAIGNHELLDEGVDFLQKPFGSREFLAKVRALLDRE
jgi:PAS domain S-box-containing protein